MEDDSFVSDLPLFSKGFVVQSIYIGKELYLMLNYCGDVVVDEEFEFGDNSFDLIS